MLTFLLCWYALGWASVWFWLRELRMLTLCNLLWMIVAGLFSLVMGFIIWADSAKPECFIVWREP